MWLEHKRYRIETIIGQLVERFNAKRIWARDAWHLFFRWICRNLIHTVADFCVNKPEDLPSPIHRTRKRLRSKGFH